MTTDIQKEREKMYAFQLAEVLGCEWRIEFPLNESEWPDLIIHERNKVFGLEIREITNDSETKKGSIRRATESTNSKRIKNLAEHYYKKSIIPLKVDFLGNIDSEIEILDLLIKFANGSRDWSREQIEHENGILYVTRLPEKVTKYTRWEFIDDRVGWVREIDSQFLIPFVAEKEKKLHKYKTYLNDVRLLLVADPTYNSGMLSFNDSGFNIKTRFDEIYFFMYPNKYIATSK